MKVCLLSSGHKPYDDRIFYKEARSLRKIHDDVTIISPYSSDIPDDRCGIAFLSIPANPLNLSGRSKTISDLYKVGLNLRADVYHCHEPESLIVALKLKKRLGCKVIFDSHEMYAASLAQKFPEMFQPAISSLYSMYEKIKVSKCDYALGASWAISDYLSGIIGSERTETILNCTPEDIFGEVPERKWSDETIICHEGNLPFERGLKTMVKAVEIVSKKYKIKFRIIGDVFGAEREWLETYIRHAGLNGIINRTGWLDYHDVGPALAHCHIGLVALQKLPNNIVTSANKEFNYMYFGIPFIAPDFRLSTIKLIADEKCGLSADSNSPESYAQAITYMIENRESAIQMGVNAKRAADRAYTWKHMEKKLLNVYSRLFYA